MLAIERTNAIMSILEAEKSVIVRSLSKRLKVTEETIRRDLQKLEAQKKIVRVHGGAYLLEGFEKGAPAALRKQFFTNEKRELGKICTRCIENKDTIFLDASTTSLFLAKEINASKLQITVITNNLDILTELVDNPNIKTIGIGGDLSSSTRSFLGPGAERTLMNYAADKGFISCASISSNFMITDHSEEEAYMRRIMLENAREIFLVIDHTKINHTSTYRIAKINDVHAIVLDKSLDVAWDKAIENLGVKILKTTER